MRQRDAHVAQNAHTSSTPVSRPGLPLSVKGTIPAGCQGADENCFNKCNDALSLSFPLSLLCPLSLNLILGGNLFLLT